MEKKKRPLEQKTRLFHTVTMQYGKNTKGVSDKVVHYPGYFSISPHVLIQAPVFVPHLF